MDNNVLRKRLQTFKSAKGTLSKISDEVIIDVLRAWELWPGTSADLYRDLEISKQQLAIIIKKGKKLIKSGLFTESEFKEVEAEQEIASPTNSSVSGCGIELVYKNNVIRFGSSDLLMDFLKKAA